MKKPLRLTGAVRRCGCILLAAALSACLVPVAAAQKLSEQYPVTSDSDAIVFQSDPDYAEILDGWIAEGMEAAPAAASIRLAGQDFIASSGQVPQKTTVENVPCLLYGIETEWVEWEFTVDTAGLYVLQMEYYATEGTGLPIQRSITIDGETPYAQAGNIVLPRRFIDDGEPRVNSLGDEVRPMQKEIRSWISRDITDAQGKYTTPLLWNLQPGTHRLRLAYIDQPVALSAITFHGTETIPTYAQLQKTYQEMGYAPASNSLVFEAEDAAFAEYRTQSAVASYNDGDPLTTPEGVTHVKMNAMGGYSWREGNQEISYQIQVPAAGLYKLAMRVQQTWGNGLASCRQILIDGKVPFQELEAYSFPYNRNWYVHELAAPDGTPYQFYLEEGLHTLTFVVKMDPAVTSALLLMQEASETLSGVIRQITLITGTEPDPNYDYDLEKAIPDLLDTFGELEIELDEAADLVMETATRSPSAVNNLEMACQQMREVRANPERIHKRLDDLSTTLTGIGDWMTELQSSPLGLDRIGLYPPDEVVPAATSNFFNKAWATLRNFAASFTKDYNAVGSFGTGEVSTVLDVWISRGKEWSAILQELIDSDFTPSTGIGVKLNILPSGALSSAVNPLMLSINSGTPPDVVLSLTNNYPVEYAIRDAVTDLSKMEGYEETVSQFDPKILTPFKYRGGVYALPETTNFRVMFYRKDIFSELKLGLPDTWDEVFDHLLPVLYQNGMQMYIPSAYDLFLFQYGGSMYTEDGLRSGLDTPAAFAAFEQLISLYLDMGIPITANFYNRFRSGEMPIGIDSYTQYVTLLTAAPELAGKWGIAPLPGTKREDGTIDRSTAILTGEADILLKSSTHQQEGWDFLQWWTSTRTQIAFGSQVEGRIGTSARWNTANLEAFESLPWNRDDLKVIQEQWKWSEDPPTVLGGYYTTRHITNALNRCLYNGQTPRDSLEEAVEQINKELQRKQQLYGVFAGEGET